MNKILKKLISKICLNLITNLNLFNIYPLVYTLPENVVDIVIFTQGGGLSGQADAIVCFKKFI